jgi:hypothetical protein
VAEQVKELPVEEYVEEVLTSPQRISANDRASERGKKAKRDAQKDKYREMYDLLQLHRLQLDFHLQKDSFRKIPERGH